MKMHVMTVNKQLCINYPIYQVTPSTTDIPRISTLESLHVSINTCFMLPKSTYRISIQTQNSTIRFITRTANLNPQASAARSSDAPNDTYAAPPPPIASIAPHSCILLARAHLLAIPLCVFAELELDLYTHTLYQQNTQATYYGRLAGYCTYHVTRTRLARVWLASCALYYIGRSSRARCHNATHSARTAQRTHIIDASLRRDARACAARHTYDGR